jgi:hypothetical protein
LSGVDRDLRQDDRDEVAAWTAELIEQGDQAYIDEFIAWMTEEGLELPDEDDRLAAFLVEDEFDDHRDPAQDLLCRGYAWALFEDVEPVAAGAGLPRRVRNQLRGELTSREDVSWEQAEALCEATGLKYQLSSEPERVLARDQLEERHQLAREACAADLFQRPADDDGDEDWAGEAFDWGVALALRRATYEDDPARARELLFDHAARE